MTNPHLLCQPLQLLQPGDLLLNHLVPLLVEGHQLVPVPLDGLGVEVAVEAAGLAPLVAEGALDVPVLIGGSVVSRIVGNSVMYWFLVCKCHRIEHSVLYAITKYCFGPYN